VNGFFDSTRPNMRLQAASRSSRFEFPVSDVCGYSRVARRCGAAAGAFALLGAAVDLVLRGAMPPSRPMLTR
jgi:hypothetical protein